ncbi:DEAD/DEAH box helicase family protein [Pseudoalteromonas sp. P1-30]|uniref:DEAD/DEAH box helicase family protein n=1 Tax=Pseudoalteromonas sp. P1-30 TaxID=1723760 RepID=UPI0006D626F8|nr:DEAD/DEAH box helicase family protein [Pseudoalteromonas sp. P1-30]
MNQAEKHREYLEKIVSSDTFEHQQHAAQRAFSHFEEGSRAVVITAEMQSGKSGIALVLAALQRLSLSDTDICERSKLKDTLYLVTMADLSLQEQAKQDLAKCNNVVVSNFTNMSFALSSNFKAQPPKLIIIDECHYGAGSEAVRYAKVFEYLEKENTNCKVAFISATPFSALYSAGADSILRHDFKTSLVFHKTSDEYLGIREMHRNNQIVKLTEEQRNFCDDSLLRKRFIRQFKEHPSSGWSLIRVPSSQANLAKNILLENGIAEEQIMVIGQKLVGVEESDLASIDDFKREYEAAAMFDDKVIAITVAGFRAGINFGQEMKSTLINTWDSTIANIAAIVQANIGRACGYHCNTQAKHYTNLDAIKAYSDLLNHLELNSDKSDFEGLHAVFENICAKYDVRGFDRGIQISSNKEYSTSSRKKDDTRTYLTQSYLAVPGKLTTPNYDYSIYTQNPLLLDAIDLIRAELLKEDGPHRKQGRALKGEHQNWIKAQWVNGVTYDDYTPSCAKSRAIEFTSLLDQGHPLEFNKVVNPGGGETTKDKRVMASVFSVYNLSKKTDAFKRSMDDDDLQEVSELLGVELDDTIILLFLRGEYSDELTVEKQDSLEVLFSRVQFKSIFKQQK